MRQVENSAPYLLIAAMFLFLGAASGAAQAANMPVQQAASKARAMKAPANGGGEGKVLAPKESLTGTISIVDTTQGLLIVTGSNGVPYNFHVTRRTQIMVGGQKAAMDDLSNQVNKQVTIEFVPRTGGNFASSVEVSG